MPNSSLDNQVRIGDYNINYAGIQVAWTITSDKRWKSDITESNLGLNFISKLKPVSYLRINDENPKRGMVPLRKNWKQQCWVFGIMSNPGIISRDDKGMLCVTLQ
ncbi:MAG: tail fiber domain-containing protein [Cytophagales bacterium]|nr:tail fiber domain-containing protein [Cytophagales bacterium]